MKIRISKKLAVAVAGGVGILVAPAFAPVIIKLAGTYIGAQAVVDSAEHIGNAVAAGKTVVAEAKAVATEVK